MRLITLVGFFGFILCAVLTVAGCKCFQPAHRNDPGCAILNKIVDCTESAVETQMAQFGPVVEQVIAKATGADGQIDWDSCEQSLIGMGIKDGGCILASLAHKMAMKKSALAPGSKEAVRAEAKLKSFAEGFGAFRKKHYGADVKFKLNIDGKAVLW